MLKNCTLNRIKLIHQLPIFFFNKNIYLFVHRLEFKKRFGVTTAFIATHSGLTRWVEINSNTADQTNREYDLILSRTFKCFYYPKFTFKIQFY